jgi:hypothetical protein
MDHEHLVCTCCGESLYTRCDCSVQPQSGLLEQQSTVCDGPLGDLGIVADDGRDQRPDGSEHMLSHRASEVCALGGVQGGREPALGCVESLDRDERHATGQLR